MSEILAVFARAPELGKVKTRLSPPLTPQQALSLHRALIEDTLAHLGKLDLPSVEKHVLLSKELIEPGDLDVPDGWQVGVQSNGDLGERMSHLFETSLAGGASGVVILGSDSPTVPLELVEDAFTHLASGHVVLGPADDGGYYLLGCDRFYADIFAGVDWGSERVLDQTLAILERLGVASTTLVPWYDIDRGDDLNRLRQEIAYLKRCAPDLVPIRVAAVLPDDTGEAEVSADTDF